MKVKNTISINSSADVAYRDPDGKSLGDMYDIFVVEKQNTGRLLRTVIESLNKQITETQANVNKLPDLYTESS